jgi:hypothetical protein
LFCFVSLEAKTQSEGVKVAENKKWKKYLKLIEKAMADYEECQSTNCSCYNR